MGRSFMCEKRRRLGNIWEEYLPVRMESVWMRPGVGGTMLGENLGDRGDSRPLKPQGPRFHLVRIAVHCSRYPNYISAFSRA